MSLQPEHFIFIYIGLPVIFGFILSFSHRMVSRYAFHIAFLIISILFASSIAWWLAGWNYQSMWLKSDAITRVMLFWTTFFAWIICLYAKGYFKEKTTAALFYGLSLITLGITYFTFLSDHLVLLAIGWGLLGLCLYLMVGMAGDCSKEAAKKTFIIVGGSDLFMIVGIVLLFHLTKSAQLSQIKVSLDLALPIASFILIFIGAFAKAGVFPFHSWLPDACECSHVPVTAFLPLSLDKLLGIYLMLRLVGSVFVMNSVVVVCMMAVGCICILVAVMMALVQHNLKRLLGYHAVSQVGYMVLGLGTGTMIGMMGAMFHMINHTIYKTLLFLSGGMVEKSNHSADLDRLGGLIKVLPITFSVMLIASMAISGIFPLNGYFSKHVVLHGIMYTQKYYGINYWQIFWILASIGGILTLSSFVKVIYALFIEKPCQTIASIKENNFWMLLPMIILALFCLTLGVMTENFTNPMFLSSLSEKYTHLHFNLLEGFIYLIAYALISTGLVLLLKRHARSCQTIGIHLYEKVRNNKMLKNIYDWAESHYMDIYDIGRRGIIGASSILRSLHTGILPSYIFWFMLGTLVFVFYYFRFL